VVTKINGELADITLEVQAIDEGIKTAVTRIDQDLEALDQRINRCRLECERSEQSFRVALDRIATLERLNNDQSLVNDALIKRVDAMEGKLCHSQGTRGDLPSGQMLSFCWFCVKLAQPLPTRQMLGKF